MSKEETGEVTPQSETPAVAEVPEVNSVPPVVPAAPVATSITEIEEYEAKKADRQLKHWVIKLVVGTVAAMFSLVCAAVIYSTVVKGGNGTDPSMIKVFLDTLLEMMKVMKTN